MRTDDKRPTHGRRSLRDVQSRKIDPEEGSSNPNGLLFQLLLEQHKQNKEMQQVLIAIVKSKIKGAEAEEITRDFSKVFDAYDEITDSSIPILQEGFVDVSEEVKLEANFTELGSETKSENPISDDHLNRLRQILKGKEEK